MHAGLHHHFHTCGNGFEACFSWCGHGPEWSETGCGGHLFSELVTTAISVSRHLHGWRLCEHVSSLVRVLSVCSIRYLITELLQFASQREPELPNPCYSRFPLCLMVFCFQKRTLLRLTIPQIDNCTCRCRFLRSEMFL